MNARHPASPEEAVILRPHHQEEAVEAAVVLMFHRLLPEHVGEPFEWSYNVVGEDIVQICYDVVTDDAKLDYIETKCIQGTYQDWDYLNAKIDEHKCWYQKEYESDPNKYTDPDWQSLHDDDLLPLPDSS